MDRRAFLRSTAIAAAGMTLPPAYAGAGWRKFEVTTHVDLAKPQGVSRVWLPLPLASGA